MDNGQYSSGCTVWDEARAAADELVESGLTVVLAQEVGGWLLELRGFYDAYTHKAICNQKYRHIRCDKQGQVISDLKCNPPRETSYTIAQTIFIAKKGQR